MRLSALVFVLAFAGEVLGTILAAIDRGVALNWEMTLGAALLVGAYMVIAVNFPNGGSGADDGAATGRSTR